MIDLGEIFSVCRIRQDWALYVPRGYDTLFVVPGSDPRLGALTARIEQGGLTAAEAFGLLSGKAHGLTVEGHHFYWKGTRLSTRIAKYFYQGTRAEKNFIFNCINRNLPFESIESLEILSDTGFCAWVPTGEPPFDHPDFAWLVGTSRPTAKLEEFLAQAGIPPGSIGKATQAFLSDPKSFQETLFRFWVEKKIPEVPRCPVQRYLPTQVFNDIHRLNQIYEKVQAELSGPKLKKLFRELCNSPGLTANLLTEPEKVWKQSVKTWRPRIKTFTRHWNARNSKPLPLAFSEHTFEGWQVTCPRNTSELVELGDTMRTCIGGYAEHVNSTEIIVAFRDPETQVMYAMHAVQSQVSKEFSARQLRGKLNVSAPAEVTERVERWLGHFNKTLKESYEAQFRPKPTPKARKSPRDARVLDR